MGRVATTSDNGKLKELNERHHVIKRMLFLGRTPTEISRVLGVTTQMISNVKNSGLMQVALGRLQDEADVDVVKVEQRIQQLLSPSLDKLEEVVKFGTLDGEVVEVDSRLRVLQNSLGRGGFPTNPKIEGGKDDSKVGRTTIEKVKMRAFELAKESGQIVELESESVTVETGG